MRKLIFIAFLGCLVVSCSRTPKQNWKYAIPDEAAFIVVPAKGTSLQSVTGSKLISTLEQFASPDLQAISTIDSVAAKPLKLKSIILYAGTHQKLQILWLIHAPEGFEKTLSERYTPAYWNGHYKFKGQKIWVLHVNNRKIYVSRLNDLMLISTASRTIEQSILAYTGKQSQMNLDKIPVKPASLIINTPEVDNWFSRLGLVKYQKSIKNILNGASPFTLKLNPTNNDAINFHLTGHASIRPKNESLLIESASFANKPVVLDQYISSDATGFAILRHSPAPLPNTLPDTTQIDSLLLHNKGLYKKLSSTLDVEFGVEMFANSGFQSTSEHLFLRRLKNPQKLKELLNKLSRQHTITKVNNTTYYTQSNVLAQLFASRLCGFKNAYIGIIDNIVVIANRKGLIGKVNFDHNQHQTIIYQGYYRQLRTLFPKKLSSLLVSGPEISSFLQPLVSNPKYINKLFSGFKYLALTTSLDSTNHQLTVNITSFNRNQSQQPYHENWTYPLRGSTISGHPVFGNLGGDPNKEVIFATKQGYVYVLASDGTFVKRYSTNGETPIGSPVIYNWFGTGHNVVLIAAGNKIYGWNTEGDLLPGFPFTLKYNITTPLVVADVGHDRTPNIIIGTENRKLHILNSHGVPIPGWPVKTNVPIQTAPYTGYFQGQPAVVAFSGNTINAWNVLGQSLPGFPLFANAMLHGSPVKFKKVILGNASNGYLYVAGNKVPFADSLNVIHQPNFSQQNIAALRISNRALIGTPSTFKNKILIADINGSIYLLNSHGKVIQKEQTISPLSFNWSPRIIDINADEHSDIIALTRNGRLYGWRTGSGTQLHDLPTTNMSHIHIGDLQGDGLKEIVGLTSEGLVCWTIFPK